MKSMSSSASEPRQCMEAERLSGYNDEEGLKNSEHWAITGGNTKVGEIAICVDRKEGKEYFFAPLWGLGC